jgi:BASS family bile acid:Na+ symporter
MLVAITAAKMFMLPQTQRSAIALECGLQNGTLGIAITITILGRTDLAIPSAVYGLLMLFTGFGYALWLRSRNQGVDA